MKTTTKISTRHAMALRNEHAISDQAIARVGLFSDGDEIVLPCRSLHGTVIGLRRRDPEGRWRSEGLGPSPAPLVFTNDGEVEFLTWAQDEDGLLALLSAGVSAVALLPGTDGADTAKAFVGLLGSNNRPVENVARFKRHVLAFDNTGAGRALRDAMSIRLKRDHCWFVTFDGEHRSVGAVLESAGRDGVDAMLAGARPIVPDQLVKFSDIPRSTSVSFSTGSSALDPHLKLSLPEVMVVSGTPNAGKSQWVLWLAANLARTQGIVSAIIQFEDDVDRHRDDLERYAKAWTSGTGHVVTLPPDEWMDRYFVTIAPPEAADETEDKTLKWLLDRIEEAAVRHGCRCVILDPWNEVEHAFGVNETESTYTGSALRQIKALARRFQLLIIIVAHPSKSAGLKTDPTDLSLYDIAGSAHWANKSDHGVMIHRQANTDVTSVNVVKCRDYRKRGRPGIVNMRLDPKSATFVPVEDMP
jgi:twinkle protein